MAEPNLIKVADVYVVQQDEQFVGVEVGFTEAVRNKRGAATSLDFMRNALSNSGWITQTIMRVEDKEDDAQANAQPEDSGSEDTQTPPQPTKRAKTKPTADS